MKHTFFYSILKGKTKWYHFILTFLLAAFGYILGQMPLSAIAIGKMANDPNFGAEELEKLQNNDLSVLDLTNNQGFLLALCMFVGCIIFLWVGVKYIHKLPFKHLISPTNSINWKKIFVGFGLWFSITVAFEAVSYVQDPDNFIWNFNPEAFFTLLLISCTLLFVQTSTEELLMRGYLMPAFGLFFKNKWAPLLLTSVMFASLHLANPEVQEYGIETMALNYILPGVFLGIITIMDDSLELALGVHWATNFSAATLVTFESSAIQTDALFKMKEMEISPIPWAFVIGGAIFYVICARIYKWRNITYLFEKLQLEDASPSSNQQEQKFV